ncbi:MAG TPA: DUF6518 family protein [Acidimicrobiales bacterium]
MKRSDRGRPGRSATYRTHVALGVIVAVVSFGLGVVTDFGQTWLPESGASVANSGGSWVLIGFALALVATSTGMAVLCGGLSLLGLVGGYYASSGVRGMPESLEQIIFWVIAAVVVGPLVGLAAGSVRRGPPLHVGVGVGALSGVLVGESIFGLTKNAQSTSAGYWWVQIGLAFILVLTIDLWRARGRLAKVMSLAAGVIVAAATYLAYFHPISVRH